MSSQTIVIIDKNGNSATKKVKDVKEYKLYSKCGFKNGNNFEKRNTFKVKGGYVFIYAKNNGRSNLVNKFEMPPPIDKELYFGNILVLKTSDKDDICHINYTSEEWEKDYEKLMGGFEDLNATEKDDDEEEDELANIPKDKLTKQGYLKDDFVVSNDSDNDADDEQDDKEYNDKDNNDSDEDDNEEDEEPEFDEDEEDTDQSKCESWSEEDDDEEEDYMSELEEEDYLSE